MIANLLSLLGITLLDTDTLAKRLADSLLRLWGSDINQLAESTGKAELQRRYMEVALTTGLPAGIARQVANRAWGYVAQAQREPVVTREGFTLYE